MAEHREADARRSSGAEPVRAEAVRLAADRDRERPAEVRGVVRRRRPAPVPRRGGCSRRGASARTSPVGATTSGMVKTVPRLARIAFGFHGSTAGRAADRRDQRGRAGAVGAARDRPEVARLLRRPRRRRRADPRRSRATAVERGRGPWAAARDDGDDLARPGRRTRGAPARRRRRASRRRPAAARRSTTAAVAASAGPGRVDERLEDATPPSSARAISRGAVDEEPSRVARGRAGRAGRGRPGRAGSPRSSRRRRRRARALIASPPSPTP